MRAKKLRDLARDELKNLGCQILSESMVDEGDQKLCDVWCQKFGKTFAEMII